jgi:hypothetical protein
MSVVKIEAAGELKGAVIASSSAAGKCELCRMTMEIFTTASSGRCRDAVEMIRCVLKNSNDCVVNKYRRMALKLEWPG